MYFFEAPFNLEVEPPISILYSSDLFFPFSDLWLIVFIYFFDLEIVFQVYLSFFFFSSLKNLLSYSFLFVTGIVSLQTCSSMNAASPYFPKDTNYLILSSSSPSSFPPSRFIFFFFFLALFLSSLSSFFFVCIFVLASVFGVRDSNA